MPTSSPGGEARSGSGRPPAARFFPPKPRPRLEVEGVPPAAASQPARPSAQVIVIDRGPGISSDEIGKIFTPFFRAGKGDGSGLGLVISRQITREHGGEIRVNSKLGEGTTFTVALPGAP